MFGILPRKELPGRTEDHIEQTEQHTTLEKEITPTLPSEFHEPSSHDDLPPPSKNTNLAQPSVADLQVGHSVENPNKRKLATHEGVSKKQESCNKKMKKSRNKVDKIKIYLMTLFLSK